MEIKEITFHTAIYNNVTLKLKCFTRKAGMQHNDTIPLYMNTNFLLGRLFCLTFFFFGCQVPYLGRGYQYLHVYHFYSIEQLCLSN